jgi:hypothetical protein
MPRFTGIGREELWPGDGALFRTLAVLPSRARVVATAAVVEALDLLEDRVGDLDPRAPSLPVEQLDLHPPRERLDDRVVVGLADGAERGQQARVLGPGGEGPGGELGSVVAVTRAGRPPARVMAVPRALVARSARRAVSMAQPPGGAALLGAPPPGPRPLPCGGSCSPPPSRGSSAVPRQARRTRPGSSRASDRGRPGPGVSWTTCGQRPGTSRS